MAGETPARPDDIEELLRQAQMAAGLAPETTPPPPPTVPAMPRGSVPAAVPELAAVTEEPALATATLAPPEAVRPRSSAGPLGDDIQYLLAQAEQAIASV